ncbi:hypothetical protein GCM10009827_110530 [Dactylosporangium maewongense]|uniref:Uncharacterized protein n=1 Tax=Dactylosporangium maewongense TaxID=634393 RepID=A0ABN2D4W7_9ACTN
MVLVRAVVLQAADWRVTLVGWRAIGCGVVACAQPVAGRLAIARGVVGRLEIAPAVGGRRGHEV